MTIQESAVPFEPGTHGSPPPEYTRRLADRPLAPVELPSGDEILAAVRFRDVKQILADLRFSRDLTYPGAPRLTAGADVGHDPDQLLNMDPPRHTRLRRIVSGVFTPRRIETWRPRVAEIAEELAGGLTSKGLPADLVSGFAFPLPIQVICELLGVPPEDRDLFRGWSVTFASLTAYTAEERKAGRAEFAGYLRALIRSRRDARSGRDGLLDALIEARDERDALTEAEIVEMAMVLIVAGHETTAAVFTRGMLDLFDHPDQLAALTADPALVPGAVEEILRCENPADINLPRVATQDVPLSSGTIKKGDAVMPLISAANLDPDAFSEPHTFDIARDEGPHMTFGHGAHHCLGANLARLELQVALETLLRKLPTLRPAVPREEIEWRKGHLLRGPIELPVTW